MHIAIIFYSFSGNTKKACEFIKTEFVKQNHGVDVIELKLKTEEKSFMRQGNAAHYRQTPEIVNTEYDLAKFDLVVFASPVWAFTFTPALRTYIGSCTGLEGRKTAVFLTCGAAITSGNALKELEGILRNKGANITFAAFVAGNKTKNLVYLADIFKKLFSNSL